MRAVLFRLWCDRGRLARDRRGGVAVEFAIWVSAFFLMSMVALDFGGFYVARSAVDKAVSAAAVQAFQSRDSAPFTAIPQYVRNLAGDQSLTVSLACNGVAGSCVNASRTCACLQGNGQYVAAQCGAQCTGTGMTANSVAGYYLRITVQGTYRPVLVPGSVLSGLSRGQSATVRLQ